MLSKAKALVIFVAVPWLFVAPGQSDSSCRSKKNDTAATATPSPKNTNRPSRQDVQREETRPNVNGAPGRQAAPEEPEKNANSAPQEMSEPEEKKDGRRAATDRVANDTWGGVHIRVEMRDGGADIEYDCAHGTIDAPLKPDGEGRFNATGTHVREGPGPIRVGRPPISRPARYTGRVSGDEMTLTVTLTDTSQEIGTFTLTRGSAGRIQKCR